MGKSIIIYLFTYSLSIILMAFYAKTNSKEKRVALLLGNFRCSLPHIKSLLWCILIIAPIVVLATIRYDVGIDWSSYLEISKYAQAYPDKIMEKNYLEIGYRVLSWISAYLFPTEWGIFFVTALIFMLFIFAICMKYKKELSMPFMLFMFYFLYLHIFYNITRQMLAAIILLYGYKFLTENKILYYIGIVFVASLLHKSALVVLAFIFIRKWVVKKSSRVHSFLFICFTSPLWTYFILGVVKRIVGIMFPKYLKFMTTTSEFSLTYVLYIFPPIIFIYYFGKEIIKSNEEYCMGMLLICLQIPIQAMGSYYVTIDRLYLYPGMIQVILIPQIIYNLKNKKTRIEAYLLFILWFVIRFIYMEFIQNGQGTAIYQTIFSHY